MMRAGLASEDECLPRRGVSMFLILSNPRSMLPKTFLPPPAAAEECLPLPLPTRLLTGRSGVANTQSLLAAPLDLGVRGPPGPTEPLLRPLSTDLEGDSGLLAMGGACLRPGVLFSLSSLPSIVCLFLFGM